MRPLADPAEPTVRAAVAAVCPQLRDAPIDLPAELDLSKPEWQAATAIVDGRFVAKFAWSEQAAVRIRREAAVLDALAAAAPRLPVPRVVAASDDQVVFVTERVSGSPLGFEDIRRLRSDELEAIVGRLATFLAGLHDASVLAAVTERVPGLVTPRPQGDTVALRRRLPRFLDDRRARLVCEWCDVVDEILARPSAARVLAHGDLHGFNQVWERGTWALRLVADFEVAGPADAEYDLRYFPSQGATLALVEGVRQRYTALTGRPLDMSRVAAWHVRTALGDALWRSEAGVPLPGGGTPASYVDDLERKLPELLAS